MAAQAGPLLDQILRAGVAAANARVTTARAEADQTIGKARERTVRTRNTALAERERAHAGALEAARAEATQRVARDTLGARAAALDRIFAAATTQLPALATHPRLAEVLGPALADALTYVPDGPVVVRCAGAVAGVVRAGIAASGRDAAVRVGETVALGAIVESADGAVSVDVTFATRLARARARLAITIAKTLVAGAS